MTMDEELGRALARLVKQNQGGVPADRPISAGWNKKMKTLSDMFHEREHLKQADRRVPVIPGKECMGESAYLEGNVDFFLDHLMSRNSQMICPGLIKHINDCYRCFEIYASVMRGFTLAQRAEAADPAEGTD
jgi:hypothetical protein